MLRKSAISGIATIAYLLLTLVPLAVYSFSNGESASIVIGQPDYTTSDSATSANGLASPRGLSFDSSGNLWVSDILNNRVLEYTSPLSSGESASIVIGQPDFITGTSATTASGLYYPSGLTFDKSGSLWVTDDFNSRVLEYTAPFSSGESASLVIGQSNFTTNAKKTSGSGMSNPAGVAFDSKGNLWVADAGNNRVLEYTTPFTDGESSSLVIGQSNLITGTSATTASGLYGPTDVAFDSSGSLWVVDDLNSRVLEYTSPFSSGESASIVIGQSGLASNKPATSASGMYGPYFEAFDSSGNLWVSDITNSRVTEYMAPFSNGEGASIVIGQPGFTTHNIETTASGQFGTFGVAFDSKGNLWVADEGNRRVLEYLAVSTATTTTVTTPTTSTTTTTTSTTSTTTSRTTAIPEFPNAGLALLVSAIVIAFTLVFLRIGRGKSFPLGFA